MEEAVLENSGIVNQDLTGAEGAGLAVKVPAALAIAHVQLDCQDLDIARELA